MTWTSVSPDSIWTEPDDRGQTILGAIDRAQFSVDISIYELGGPHIAGALENAKQRGVNIRVMFNGQFFKGNDPTNYKYDQQYAVINQLTGAPGDGTVALHWASNNFNITHQKTIIIDAQREGELLDASQLPASAKALVMTNNLNTYGWEMPNVKDPLLPFQFWGNGYPGNGKGVRDFGVVITTPDVVAKVAAVFQSDFSCDDSGDTNDLKDSRDGLVWSNGTTGIYPAPSGQYPANGAYPRYSEIGDYPDAVDQGNARAVHLDVIEGARGTLLVYNEEMNDDQIVQYLVDAANRGVHIRVSMTGSTSESNGKRTYNYSENFDKLVAAGAEVRLFPNSNDFMYIHAKVLLADAGTADAVAFMGSQNISGNSLDFNRELGVVLTGDQDTAFFQQTFETDWNTEGLIHWQVDDAGEPSSTDYHRKRYQGEYKETFIPPMPCGTIGPR